MWCVEMRCVVCEIQVSDGIVEAVHHGSASAMKMNIVRAFVRVRKLGGVQTRLAGLQQNAVRSNNAKQQSQWLLCAASRGCRLCQRNEDELTWQMCSFVCLGQPLGVVIRFASSTKSAIAVKA